MTIGDKCCHRIHIPVEEAVCLTYSTETAAFQNPNKTKKKHLLFPIYQRSRLSQLTQCEAQRSAAWLKGSRVREGGGGGR